MLLPEKVVTFDFPGCDGLTFDLAYLSKESSQALYKKCQIQKIDPRTRISIEELDDDKFLELYVKAIVRGWKGFKIKYVSELVLIDQEEDEDAELAYTDDNALALMKNSSIFDTWISEVLSDLGNFTKKVLVEKLTVSKDT